MVSTRRGELNAICDHMNIQARPGAQLTLAASLMLGAQVDNPLNILTQDSARQFLSASNARDKYKFFMEGTQLQQLIDAYNVLTDKIEALKVRPPGAWLSRSLTRAAAPGGRAAGRPEGARGEEDGGVRAVRYRQARARDARRAGPAAGRARVGARRC